MPPRSAVTTDKAPAPLPQFSQALVCGSTIYCSGNIGWDPKTSELVGEGVYDQAIQALKNLSAVLDAAGSSFKDVVKVNCFLTTMQNFAAFNKAYDQFFPNDPKPCRTTVAVKELPFQALVEIEMTAVKETNATTPRL